MARQHVHKPDEKPIKRETEDTTSTGGRGGRESKVTDTYKDGCQVTKTYDPDRDPQNR